MYEVTFPSTKHYDPINKTILLLSFLLLDCLRHDKRSIYLARIDLKKKYPDIYNKFKSHRYAESYKKLIEANIVEKCKTGYNRIEYRLREDFIGDVFSDFSHPFSKQKHVAKCVRKIIINCFADLDDNDHVNEQLTAILPKTYTYLSSLALSTTAPASSEKASPAKDSTETPSTPDESPIVPYVPSTTLIEGTSPREGAISLDPISLSQPFSTPPSSSPHMPYIPSSPFTSTHTPTEDLPGVAYQLYLNIDSHMRSVSTRFDILRRQLATATDANTRLIKENECMKKELEVLRERESDTSIHQLTEAKIASLTGALTEAQAKLIAAQTEILTLQAKNGELLRKATDATGEAKTYKTLLENKKKLLSVYQKSGKITPHISSATTHTINPTPRAEVTKPTHSTDPTPPSLSASSPPTRPRPNSSLPHSQSAGKLTDFDKRSQTVPGTSYPPSRAARHTSSSPHSGWTAASLLSGLTTQRRPNQSPRSSSSLVTSILNLPKHSSSTDRPSIGPGFYSRKRRLNPPNGSPARDKQSKVARTHSADAPTPDSSSEPSPTDTPTHST